jgi:hypothetical protein
MHLVSGERAYTGKKNQFNHQISLLHPFIFTRSLLLLFLLTFVKREETHVCLFLIDVCRIKLHRVTTIRMYNRSFPLHIVCASSIKNMIWINELIWILYCSKNIPNTDDKRWGRSSRGVGRVETYKSKLSSRKFFTIIIIRKRQVHKLFQWISLSVWWMSARA